jgi:hypothetical protein
VRGTYGRCAPRRHNVRHAVATDGCHGREMAVMVRMRWPSPIAPGGHTGLPEYGINNRLPSFSFRSGLRNRRDEHRLGRGVFCSIRSPISTELSWFE